jgi:NitT/TauT family transport system ATP-binding protein
MDGDERKQNPRQQQQSCDRPPADEASFPSRRVYCITALPSTIKAGTALPLERSPQQLTMMSSKFLGSRRGLTSLIPEESIKAMGR